MTTGDTDDAVNRMLAVLPPWFPDLENAPVLKAILQATGDAFAFAYAYLGFARQQTRIRTATGGFLDLIAWDYFASRFVRRAGETDASFQARILQELLRSRQTRAALSQMLLDLTGQAPVIREPWNPQDYGGYGQGVCGYGVGDGYGSLSYPYQIFVDAFTPGQGIPLVSGYGQFAGGYGVGTIEYGDLSQIAGPVTNAEITTRVAQTVAAGITAWVNIRAPGAAVVNAGKLNFSVPQQSALTGII